MKSFSFQSEIFHLDKLKLHYLEVSSKILKELNDGEESGKFNQRVIANVNGLVNWQAGIVALGEGKGYIALSKERMKKLGVNYGDTVTVELTKDTSTYGHEFPKEFEEVLLQDPEAKSRFDAMSPGKQRTIIYYILQVKSSDKRIERALFFMHNLKRCPEGNETMRILFGKE